MADFLTRDFKWLAAMVTAYFLLFISFFFLILIVGVALQPAPEFFSSICFWPLLAVHRGLRRFFLYLTSDRQLADAYSGGVENGIGQRWRRWRRTDFANPGRSAVIVQYVGFE